MILLIAPSGLQVIFLILELGTFVSGVLFGFCQLCKLHSDKPEKISEMAHRLRVGNPCLLSCFLPVIVAFCLALCLSLLPCSLPVTVAFCL